MIVLTSLHEPFLQIIIDKTSSVFAPSKILSYCPSEFLVLHLVMTAHTSTKAVSRQHSPLKTLICTTWNRGLGKGVYIYIFKKYKILKFNVCPGVILDPVWCTDWVPDDTWDWEHSVCKYQPTVHLLEWVPLPVEM